MSSDLNDVQLESSEGQENSLPELYFNGFNIGVGSGDTRIELTRTGQPVAVLYASFTVAKTLGQALNGVIGAFEAATETSIQTTHEIDAKLKEMSSGST